MIDIVRLVMDYSVHEDIVNYERTFKMTTHRVLKG